MLVPSARHPSPLSVSLSVFLLPSMPIVPVYQITVHSPLMELGLLKLGLLLFFSLKQEERYSVAHSELTTSGFIEPEIWCIF